LTVDPAWPIVVLNDLASSPNKQVCARAGRAGVFDLASGEEDIRTFTLLAFHLNPNLFGWLPEVFSSDSFLKLTPARLTRPPGRGRVAFVAEGAGAGSPAGAACCPGRPRPTRRRRSPRPACRAPARRRGEGGPDV
jgi:hypothetical protein